MSLIQNMKAILRNFVLFVLASSIAGKAPDMVKIANLTVPGKNVPGKNVPKCKEGFVGDIDMSLSHDVNAAVQIVVDYVNNSTSILPNTKIVLEMGSTVEMMSTFQAIQTVCRQINRGVSAIIGPLGTTSVKATQPICAGMHVPQVAPVATDPTLSIHNYMYPFLLKMSAPDSFQSKAIYDLSGSFFWNNVAVMTSSDDYGKNGLMNFRDLALRNHWTVSIVVKFTSNHNNASIDVRRQLREIIATGARVVILNCYALQARVILKQAADLGMTRKGWAWITTDAVTTFGTLYNTCAEVPLHLQGLLGTRPASGKGKMYEILEKTLIQTSNIDNVTLNQPYALRAIDAVLVVAAGLHSYFEDGNDLDLVTIRKDACSNSSVKPRKDGLELLKHIKAVQVDGTMNFLNFTAHAFPSFVAYDIVNLQKDGWKVVGYWTPDQFKINRQDVLFSGRVHDIPQDTSPVLENKSIRIVTIEAKPFLMPNTNSGARNEKKFRGYFIDLINELQKELKFNYHIHIVADEKYGAYDQATGKWNGMVGELIDNEADFAVGPLTITYEREKVIDFTKPFLDLGLTILMAKENKSYLWKFLQPFQLELWIAYAGCMLIAGVAVWACNSFSPYGFHGRHAQRHDLTDGRFADESMKLSISNSLHFAFASFVNMGTESIPRCLSGRIIGNIWWLCAFFLTSSYTANLAAFLTVARLETGITGVEDLIRYEDTMDYGTVKHSQVESFFQRQDAPIYERMYSYMLDQNTLVNTTEDGIEMARESFNIPAGSNRKRYAFIFDATILEYAKTKAPCRTMTVGRLFGKIGYGIGLKKNSPYVQVLSETILKLRENGFTEKIRKEWFTGDCDEESSTDTGGDHLSLTSMLGIIYVFCGALVIGLIALFLECLVATKRDIKKYKDTEEPKTLREAFKLRFQKIVNDFRFTMKHCWPKISRPDSSVAKRERVTPSLNVFTIRRFERNNNAQNIDGSTVFESYVVDQMPEARSTLRNDNKAAVACRIIQDTEDIRV